MNETERFKFRLSANKEEYEKRIPSDLKILTLNQVNKIIDEKDIEDTIKEKLKKMARNYPFQALSNFIKNIDRNISKLRKKQ